MGTGSAKRQEDRVRLHRSRFHCVDLGKSEPCRASQQKLLTGYKNLCRTLMHSQRKPAP